MVTFYFSFFFPPSNWPVLFPQADFASLTDYLCYIYLPLPLPPNPSTGGFTVHFTTEEGVDIARAAPACSNAHSLLNTKTNQAVERRKNTSVVEQDFEETRKHTSTPERDSEERREKNENAREQDSELSRRKSPNLVEEVLYFILFVFQIFRTLQYVCNNLDVCNLMVKCFNIRSFSLSACLFWSLSC